MRGIVIKVIVNAIAIWVATVIVPGVDITASDTGHKVLSLAVVGALFGIVNAFIKPIVTVLSLPFYVLSLGLFAFVVNAFMLKLADWLSGAFGIAFSSGHFFWSTIGAAIVVSLVSWLLSILVKDS